MDFSWSELLIVGIVALIFIGPKDLPGMFRELGRFTAKVRAMGREFSRAMDQAAKETGVKDVADDLRKVANPKAMGLDAVKSAADKFEKWDPLKNAAKPSAPAATAAATATAAPAATALAPAASTVDAAAIGPATAELAGKVAKRKAEASDTAARLRAAKAAPSPATPAPAAPVQAEAAADPAPTAKRGGRVRKKPAAATEDGA
jgi:sec-independent protein translocase protein TatB